MTVTTYPAPTDTPDLAVLNLTRLLTRLEHNFLSPNADLKSLRRSEFQRMRVGANIEYARAHLQALERDLPQIKPVDRRHDLQSSLARNRQTLKRLQNVLDEIQTEIDALSSARSSTTGQADETYLEEEGDDDGDIDSINGEDLLGTPSTTTEEGSREDITTDDIDDDSSSGDKRDTDTTPLPPPSIPKEDESLKSTPKIPPPSTTSSTSPATLRNRHHVSSTTGPTSSTATSTSFHDGHTPPHPQATEPSTSTSKAQEAEEALSSDRLEQENLTSSLLSLATQLKTSSQAFQASLEAEKSVLARAVDGLDRTTSNMQAAEQRMGMLRRMTEGKGWWGRMMLYAWIFGLWVVALLIVYVGPKLRF